MLNLLSKARASGPLTFWLVAVTVVAYLGKPWLFETMALYRGNGWWAPVTAAFMHVSISHLAMNMVMLGLIGPTMERRLGSGMFALVYIAAAWSSSMTVLWLDPTAVTVGASGAIFALMALLVPMSADMRAPLALLGANVVFTFITANVSVWGHLGGLIAGAAMAYPALKEKWPGVIAVAIIMSIPQGLSTGLWNF